MLSEKQEEKIFFVIRLGMVAFDRVSKDTDDVELGDVITEFRRQLNYGMANVIYSIVNSKK